MASGLATRTVEFLILHSKLRRADPSRTAGLAKLYGEGIARRLAALDTALRTSIITNDALGLEPSPFVHAIPPAGRFEWAALDSATRQRNFQTWLENAIKAGVLESTEGTVPPWLKTFVRAAYRRGVTTAVAQVIAKSKDLAGLSTATESLNAILATPFHVERLEALFERNFTELEGFTAQMGTKLQRALADGLAAGQNPRAIARTISDEIGISKERGRLIARTETIRTNAEAQLNTFERFGIEDVAVEAEWLTAEDGRVCPLCAPNNGRVLSIDAARGMIPLHPNCRCAWIPVVKKEVM